MESPDLIQGISDETGSQKLKSIFPFGSKPSRYHTERIFSKRKNILQKNLPFNQFTGVVSSYRYSVHFRRHCMSSPCVSKK